MKNGINLDIELFVINTSDKNKYTNIDFQNLKKVLESKYKTPTAYELMEEKISTNKIVNNINSSHILNNNIATNINNIKNEKNINNNSDNYNFNSNSNSNESNIEQEINKYKKESDKMKFKSNILNRISRSKNCGRGKSEFDILIIPFIIMVNIILIILKLKNNVQFKNVMYAPVYNIEKEKNLK